MRKSILPTIYRNKDGGLGGGVLFTSRDMGRIQARSLKEDIRLGKETIAALVENGDLDARYQPQAEAAMVGQLAAEAVRNVDRSVWVPDMDKITQRTR